MLRQKLILTSEKHKKIPCMVLSKCMRCAYRFVGHHFIRSGNKLYRQAVGIPMGTLFVPPWLQIYSCFCYVRDIIMSLSNDKHVDIIDAFNTTSRYMDDILNIDIF